MRSLPTEIADFDSLPRSQLINQHQLAALLQVSVDTLTRWREDRLPPPPMPQRGRIIRYSVGAVRDYIAALHEPSPAAEPERKRRKVDPRSSLSAAEVDALQSCALLSTRLRKHGGSFLSFVSTGSPSDEWLFELVGPHERPVSIFEAIRLGLGESDDSSVKFEWISLAAYTDRLSRSLSSSRMESLEELIPPAQPANPRPQI